MKARRYEDEEEEQDLPPRKRRFGLYCFFVVILAILIVALGFILLFHVQNIEVSGNEYGKSEEVIEWVQKDKLTTNSLYVILQHKFTKIKELPYVESSKVRMKNPWTIVVEIAEKEIVGYTTVNDKYVYFDKAGMVLIETSEPIANIPMIEGLEVESSTLYEVLPVGDKKVFQYIVDVTEVVKKYQLTPDRIVCSGKDVNLYFKGICVQLGHSNLNDRMLQIPAILPNIEGKNGTLHLENFSDLNTTSGFVEEVLSEESDSDE